MHMNLTKMSHARVKKNFKRTWTPAMCPVSGMYPSMCEFTNVPPSSVILKTLPSFVTMPSTCETALCICG